MLRSFVNEVIKRYLRFRFRTRIQDIKYDALNLQQLILRRIISNSFDTVYTKKYKLDSTDDYAEFKSKIPITTYEDLFPYINRMLLGEENVLCRDKINWFSKSSGTTNDKSKYIPISEDYIKENLIGSSWDTTCLVNNNRPNSRLFADKSLIMGGSIAPFRENSEVVIGDVSAIMISTIPNIGRPFYTPDFSVALLPDWNEKLEKIIDQCLKEDVVMFGGVPTWNIVLFNKILEHTGKKNILEVWPNLKTYLHGGVSFTPYREQFKKFIPTDDFDYVEIYNASEGYFAVQDLPGFDNGMLLLTNNAIFFEFIEMKNFDQGIMEAITLKDVELNKSYAMLITNICGLWRYMPGDTVVFTSLNPFRISVTGRTKQYINAFGEEVMVANTDAALLKTCQALQCEVSDYTVAPIFLDGQTKGGHEWLIEFEKAPLDIKSFEVALDKNLREQNSDYDAKRSGDLALINLKIKALPKGTFYQWMEFKGKVGGQNKVPRLSNDRKYMDEINAFLK